MIKYGLCGGNYNLRMSEIALQPADNVFFFCVLQFLVSLEEKVSHALKAASSPGVLSGCAAQVVRAVPVLTCQKNAQGLPCCLIWEGQGLWYLLVPVSSPPQYGKAALMALTCLANLLQSKYHKPVFPLLSQVKLPKKY